MTKVIITRKKKYFIRLILCDTVDSVMYINEQISMNKFELKYL